MDWQRDDVEADDMDDRHPHEPETEREAKRSASEIITRHLLLSQGAIHLDFICCVPTHDRESPPPQRDAFPTKSDGEETF